MRGDRFFGRPEAGGPIVWACRQAVACGVVGLMAYYLLGHWDRLAPGDAAPKPAPAAIWSNGAARNTLTYPTDAQGDVQLDADVDGTNMHFLVDTGATMVTLTLRDAEAAGIDRANLDFSRPMNTANGRVRAAPVTLREVRLGQLALDDVEAVVLPNLQVSLLGMSFLSRLERWEMGDGALTISW